MFIFLSSIEPNPHSNELFRVDGAILIHVKLLDDIPSGRLVHPRFVHYGSQYFANVQVATAINIKGLKSIMERLFPGNKSNQINKDVFMIVKFDIGNVKCARATSLIFDWMMVVPEEQSMWQKCPTPGWI